MVENRGGRNKLASICHCDHKLFGSFWSGERDDAAGRMKKDHMLGGWGPSLPFDQNACLGNRRLGRCFMGGSRSPGFGQGWETPLVGRATPHHDISCYPPLGSGIFDSLYAVADGGQCKLQQGPFSLLQTGCVFLASTPLNQTPTFTYFLAASPKYRI